MFRKFTNIDVMTADKTELERFLLEIVQTNPQVLGAMLIRHDGELLAVLVPEDQEPEDIARYCVSAFKDSLDTVQTMGHSALHGLLSVTSQGFFYIANFEDRYLIALGTDYSGELTYDSREFSTGYP
ncbi:MAG: hypothetical protein IPO31_12385 [Candidatus Obscuribacter sp.]|nr:hypothetical protein [Candidatus Obscuribacter sp.]